MKTRIDIFNSRKAALLGGAMLMAIFPATAALAQNANESNWYSNGILDAGTNIFIQKPGSGFGKSSTNPFWLTPKTTDSNAKMDEYGKVPRSVFLNEFGVQAGSKDGRYAFDFWADNVGMDNQRYYLGLYEPGRQYLYMGWDQTPHLLSSSAKSIFGGVGSTRLTVDSTSRTYLQTHSNVASQSQHNRNCIDDYINGRVIENPGTPCAGFPGATTFAPINNIELKTMREKFTIGYRNTMLDNWDFNVDYSHEHRTGTRPLGIGFGQSTTNANPRPSSGSVEVPQPLDDRTQNVNASGEYVGKTPWGTRWNTSLKYAGSFFSNDNKSIDVDNPFCKTGVGGCNGTGAGGGPFGPSLLRYGLYADNNANGVTWNNAVEIPIFKSRYTSNMQYTMFRQNDTFLNDISNGQVALAPYPASSLNGEVNAFLTNNVLYSHLTKDLTNTARVRYYDRKDNTPTLAFTNYVYADTGTNATQPLTRMPHSYTRLNLEDDLKWQPNRTWTFGAGYFFERFSYQNGEVDSTSENGAKVFVNWTPWTWASARSSLQYSQRRYDNYLAVTSTDAAANAMRYFFVANRDRTKASTIIEVQLTKDIAISPNGGVRWDNYPSDTWLNLESLGTKYDRSWNIGSDLSIRLSPALRLMFGYNHEEHYLRMETCCGGAAGGFSNANRWSSDISQAYNTFIVSADWNAIPGKLDFKVDYLAAVSNETNLTTPCTSLITNCTGAGTGVTLAQVQFPDEHNIFQRFNLIMKYYVDPTFVKRMGWIGDVTLKARYTWERNHNTNWATDNFSPYSPSSADSGGDTTNGGKSLFLAYANPNYTAQLLVLSLAARW